MVLRGVSGRNSLSLEEKEQGRRGNWELTVKSIIPRIGFPASEFSQVRGVCPARTPHLDSTSKLLPRGEGTKAPAQDARAPRPPRRRPSPASRRAWRPLRRGGWAFGGRREFRVAARSRTRRVDSQPRLAPRRGSVGEGGIFRACAAGARAGLFLLPGVWFPHLLKQGIVFQFE